LNPQLREKGDWIEQTKKILGQGPSGNRDLGDRPDREHRSTKKAVRLLLSNLRTGAGKTKDKDTTEDDIRKVVFNAVDLLIEDKIVKSKKDKTKLEALKKFGDVLAQEFTAQSQKRDGLDSQWKKKIDEAVRALRIEELERIHGEGGITEEMLGTKENQEALAAKPEFGGAILSAVDPAWLDNISLDTASAQFKNDVLSEALLAIAKKKSPLKTGGELDRKDQFDPTLFSKLAVQVDPDVWNDKAARKRGLGPRVCQTLWRNGNYDQICELIRHGVDTSLAARVMGGELGGAGVYSGFVQPVQHIASNHIRDIALLEANDPSLPGYRRGPAQGAKKILQALDSKGTAVTLTKWSDVKNSEMIAEFQKNPGTIWGFEDVRIPYVQAAHETAEGLQPLRMMELWEAVMESLPAEAYNDMLDDPASAIDEFVKTGVEKIKDGLVSIDQKKKEKYALIARDSKTFIQNFERDAKAFLTEYAAQMPRGTFARPGKGGNEATQTMRVSFRASSWAGLRVKPGSGGQRTRGNRFITASTASIWTTSPITRR